MGFVGEVVDVGVGVVLVWVDGLCEGYVRCIGYVV